MLIYFIPSATPKLVNFPNMKCNICGEDKLSKEFLYKTISLNCTHPPLHCMTCIIEKLSEDECCPYLGCGANVANAESLVTDCKNDLDQLYPTGNVEQLNCFSDEQVIKVVMLTGDFEMFSYDSSTTVDSLKTKIAVRFKVNTANQQLMYEDCVLQETEGGRFSHLSDYNVKPFSTIHLLVLMYAIPKNCNHVTFDLSWCFPEGKCDALDASCFIFSGKSCLGIVDYCQTEYGKKSVWHSGDDMDALKKTGRHTIDAKMKDIPSYVTHLFFTLSAWNSPTLAHYRNPCLKFFEASNKDSDLCQTTFSHALDFPAVIMCYVERVGEQWKIFQCGNMSCGNAKDYEPLKSSIQKLIKSDNVPMANDASRKVITSNEVDLAFAMDCTSSMGSYISQAQQNIRAIAEEIGRHCVNLRFALIEYRDHPPQYAEFVTRVLDFTDSLSRMKARVDACSSRCKYEGAPDEPEAVADALNDVLKLSWRATAIKICVFISDAPPHGLCGRGDHFPTGCPKGYEPMQIANQIAAKGVVIYMVGCEPSILPYKDWFMAIAHITGGQYVPLTLAQMLASVIVGGTMEEISLKTLLEDVTAEVQKLSTVRDGSVIQETFEEQVYQKMRGTKTKKLAAGATELPSPTAMALNMAQKRSMAEVRKVFALGTPYSTGLVSATISAAASFSAVEGDVTRSQVSRMVQRVLMTTGLKCKCATRR